MLLNTRGLYIHIPFRINKHNYRGNLSYYNMDFYIKAYFESLKKELKLYKEENLFIDSIYIGGGDPCSVEETYIVDILEFIYRNFKVLDNCEKTIEIDPSVPEYRIKEYIHHGINRFSVKAITFDEKGLESLDIGHDKTDILKITKALRKYNIKNINFDMFFSYPGQTISQLKKDIKYISKLDIPHVSFYSQKSDEEIIHQLGNDKNESNLLDTIRSDLKKNGLIHYEINHFAKSGYRSYHNMKYWNLDNYIGVGLGASSFVNGTYYKNYIQFEDYFKAIKNGNLPYSTKEKWSNEEYEKNYIISKMGMIGGININEINEKFGIDFLSKYKEIIDAFIGNNIIEKDKKNIKFTSEGMYYSNKFFLEII